MTQKEDEMKNETALRTTCTLRLIRRLAVAAVVTAPALVGTPLPASAEGATITAPYPRSETSQWCDVGAVCATTTGAEKATGNVLVDLSVLGTQSPTPRYCPAQWPGDPTCFLPGLRSAGGTGSARVIGRHMVTEPVGSVTFTVTVRTDEGRAQSSSGKAWARVWASAAPASSSTCSCSGATLETVVDSDTQPTAAAAIRRLRITYRNSSGAKVPAGPVDIAGGITADAGGEGSSSVRLPATVVSIAASP